MWLYILELEPTVAGGPANWYVGITAKQDPHDRIDAHFAGKGAKWTQMHAPVKIARTVAITDDKDKALAIEDQITLALMNRKGATFVRGGKWCCRWDCNVETGPTAIVDIWPDIPDYVWT
jgi:predicted GIY-YIG superfamily endonuclease